MAPKEQMTMRRVMAVAALGILGMAVSAERAAAGGLDLRAGAFFPRAESNLFDDDTELYTIDKNDWVGFSGGAEYNLNLSDNVELGLSVDGYSRTKDTVYRDFTRPSGREIEQTLKLTTVPVGATLKYVFNARRGAFTPYVGVGADIVYYEYEEFGDFIDFNSNDLDVVGDDFFDSGAAPGFHAVAGLRFPLGDDFSLTAEGRYLWAKKDMGEDFRQNEIDLSGPSATIGLNIRF
jgi:opacity protein-like surface antigen